MIRPLLSTLLLVASLVACTPLSARSLVEVTVIDRDDGQLLQQHAWRGDRWIAGIPGHRYTLRLTNTTGERVLAVLSVDGVNAVSGEDADPGQAGYVLGPWESAEINGWRKSLDDVAQFAFTALPDSYAARTGRPDNVGIIGVAAFRERRVVLQRPYEPEREYGSSDDAMAKADGAARAPSAAMESADGMAAQRIGTAHGAREWSPIGQTAFERATPSPSQVTELRYDTPERLVAMGVLPRRPSWWSQRDSDRLQAFPGGFVADPPRR